MFDLCYERLPIWYVRNAFSIGLNSSIIETPGAISWSWEDKPRRRSHVLSAFGVSFAEVSVVLHCLCQFDLQVCSHDRELLILVGLLLWICSVDVMGSARFHETMCNVRRLLHKLHGRGMDHSLAARCCMLYPN